MIKGVIDLIIRRAAPVSASCLTPPGFDQLNSDQLALLDRLSALPDPRSRQGRRHELGYVLGLAIAAMAAVGHDSVSALAQWAAEVPARIRAALGGRVDPFTGCVPAPSRPTLGRVLATVDADRLQAAADAWTAAAGEVEPEPDAAGESEPAAGEQDQPGGDEPPLLLPAVAIDGKSVRGAAAGGNPRPHLLAVTTHDTKVVLTQRQIPDKGSEIHELAPLIAPLGLEDTVVTLDALHTQRATAAHLVEAKGAHYVMTVKANQPTLLEAVQRALAGPTSDFDPEHVATNTGHGRTETRTTRVAAVTDGDGIDWPHAATMFRIRRDTVSRVK